MKITHWAVNTALLAALSAVRAEIWITEKLLARPSSEINLSCGSDIPYSSCSWVLPSNSSCSSIRPGMTSQCREVRTVYFDASEDYCNITVNSVKHLDSGVWTCELEYPDRVDSATTEIVVFEEAAVDFENAFGTISNIAGNTESLTCQATHGRPLGQFTWKRSKPDGTEEILESGETRVSPVGEPGSGLFDAEQTLEFELKPSDDGAKIICTFQQHGFQDDIIADKSVDIDLKVDFLEVKSFETNLQEGSPFNISAQIYGSPTPKVTWQISRGENLKVNLTDENPTDEQHYLNRMVASDHHVYLSTLIINSLPVNDEVRTYTLFVESPNEAVFAAVEQVKISAEGEEAPLQEESTSLTIIVIIVICVLILIIVIVLTLLYAKKNHKWCFYVSSPQVSAEEKMQAEPLHDQASGIIKHHPYGRP